MESAESRTALVTGSGKGVGAGVVKVLASHGIRCCINCNTHPEMAQDTLHAVEEAGGEAFIWQADVTDPDQLSGMVNAVVDRWGRLDILVNNAAMQLNLTYDEYRADNLRRVLRVNLRGYALMSRLALPPMQERGWGRIVNIPRSTAKGRRLLTRFTA